MKKSIYVLIAVITLSQLNFSCLQKNKATNYSENKITENRDLIPYRKGDKWGYCHSILAGIPNREIVIECKYDDAFPFKDSIAKVCILKKYGLIDVNGKEITPIKYDKMENFVNGLAEVKLNEKYGIINKEGKELIPVKCDRVGYINDELIAIMINNKWGFINKEGKEVTPVKYEEVSVFSKFKEGLAPVKLNERWGFINKVGKEIIPFKYEEVYDFSEGFAPVKLNEKWGFINKDGKEIVPLKYFEVWSFKEGLAVVSSYEEPPTPPQKHINTERHKEDLATQKVEKKEDKKLLSKHNSSYERDLLRLLSRQGYVNTKGKEVIPLIYKYVYEFNEGLASVKLGDKNGFINKEGKNIIPNKYDFANNFKDGIAEIFKEDNTEFVFDALFTHKKIGYIDKNGSKYWEEK